MRRRSLQLLCGLCMVVLFASPPPKHVPPSPPVVPVQPIQVTLPDSWSVLGDVIRDQGRWYESAASAPAPVSLPKRVTHRTGSWDAIAQCESGGDWTTNTGNSYFGGLQMNMQFWRAYGGEEFAPRPDQATREQQIAVAERARDSGRGYGPWPVCGSRG